MLDRKTRKSVHAVAISIPCHRPLRSAGMPLIVTCSSTYGRLSRCKRIICDIPCIRTRIFLMRRRRPSSANRYLAWDAEI